MIADPRPGSSSSDHPHHEVHRQAAELLHGSDDESDLESAVTLLATHLSEHPEDAAGYCLLSEALLVSGKPEESLEAALEALKLAPEDDGEPAHRAGLALFDMSALGEGLDPDEEIELDPAIHFIEGILDIPPMVEPRLGEQALEMFEKASERDPEEGAFLYWAGICLMNLGRKDEALEVIEKGLDLTEEPEHAAHHLFLAGLLLEDLGQPDVAAERYAKALELHDGEEGARIRLAWIDPAERAGFLSRPQVEGLLDHVSSRLSESVETALTEEKIEPRPEPPHDLAFLASVCTGTLVHSLEWAGAEGVDPDLLTSFLAYHGAVSDCEVLYNLESRLYGLPDDCG